MTFDRELFYWESNPEWYRVNEAGQFELTDKAPERAVRSFNLAKTQRSEMENPFINLKIED